MGSWTTKKAYRMSCDQHGQTEKREKAEIVRPAADFTEAFDLHAIDDAPA
jgi:hypothetical protein